MDSITRDALKRVAQMHSNVPHHQTKPRQPPIEQKPQQNIKNIPQIEKEPKTAPLKPEKRLDNMVDILLGNKEQSLILLLLVLLMNENSDPSLLLALMYLLL
jgi:hypothetical protein